MHTGRKILTDNTLATTQTSWADRKVVFTNGCFDILHAGHVDLLEKARNLGDLLIVGVNDDASVNRLKGDSRPINSLENRMRVLAGLAAVDFVIHFSEDTPLNLIQQVKPQILVKGGDYTLETIIGADFVIKSGGSVEIIPLTEGYSTTAIVERMNRKA